MKQFEEEKNGLEEIKKLEALIKKTEKDW